MYPVLSHLIVSLSLIHSLRLPTVHDRAELDLHVAYAHVIGTYRKISSCQEYRVG